MLHSTCLQLALLLTVTSGVSCQLTAYYGYLGYSSFTESAQVLQFANESISLSFKICETDGILLYATDKENQRYFAVGVHRSKILVEFDLGNDIREIQQVTELASNTWYNITLLNLGLGSDGFNMFINGEDTPTINDTFSSVDLSVLDNTVYVGGHPSPRHIESRRLRCTLDACMQFFEVGGEEIDLFSSGQDVVDGCPADHCKIITKATFSSASSYLSFQIEERTTSFMKLQLDFQTSAPDGLLAVTASSSSNYLIVYLVDGHVAVAFSADGVQPSTITSTDVYHDAVMHHLRLLYDVGTIRMIVDGADRQSTEVFVHTFSQSDTLWFGTIVQDNFILPSDVPSTAATACLYNIAYSNTGQLQLFDPKINNASESVVYDACVPTLICPNVCDPVSEHCYFMCVCTDGFEGEGGACQEIDECDPNPCQHGATCIDQINDYQCICTNEFNKGKNCDIANSCIPNPCQNNGMCFDYDFNYLCNCTTGWSGLNCTINANDCEPDSCMNGGTCIDLLDDFACSCKPGYTGDFCEVDIDECAEQPCENGATCKDFINAFQCTCALGYTGGTCAEEIDECMPNPCLNGGSCTDGIGYYNCTCPATYTGTNCDLDIDECLSDPCYHGGTCINQEGGFDCLCGPGFTGPLCIGDVLECLLYQPCQNEAICQEKEEGGYECLCPDGWIGENCTESFDDCASQPCFNNANCIDGHLSVTCECPVGYTGPFCEVYINECDPNPCMNGALCIDYVGGFFCLCSAGFTGVTCEVELGTCDVAPCQNNGTCVDTVDGYVCECVGGYTGTNCDVDIDDCSPNPCQNNGTCTNKINDFVCDCLDGYEGKTCDINIDDCTPNPCLFESPCIDQVNGYKCDCHDGLIGLRCEISIKECVTEPCLNGATCEELDIGYNCICAAGFTGSNCQSDIDECLDTPCQYGGNCTNIFGGYFCSCLAGTSGDNCQVNIDDCADDPCENGATCEDQINDYNCICQLGYTGTNCSIEIDECLLSPCENGGTCTDLKAAFECSCPPTFTGSVCSIPVDVCAYLNPCKNGSQCTELTNVSSDNILDYYTCQCSIGYTDKNCSTNIDDCSPNPCLNGAKCTDALNDYVCSCLDGLTGKDCQHLNTFTITVDNGYISFPVLPSDFDKLYITMFFATTLPSGVILYQGGFSSSDYLGDFLSLELINGVLLVKYEAGGGLNEEKSIELGESLNDGSFHHISLSLQADRAICLVDLNNCTSGVSCYGEIPVTDPIEFNGPLYIGGINDTNVLANITEFHLDENISLISTIKDLRINNTAIDYASVVDSEAVALGMTRDESLCNPDPCVNGGQCLDRWTSSLCACPNGYDGPTCTILRTAHLNGKTIIEFNTSSTITTITFDFTTNSDGLLMRAIETQEKEQLIMHLDDQYVTVEVVAGEEAARHTNLLEEQLTDGEWYHYSIVFSNASIITTLTGEGSICSESCISMVMLPDDSELSFEFAGQVTFGDVGSLLSETIVNQLIQTTGAVGCVRDLLLDETVLSLGSEFGVAEPGCPRDSNCLTDPCSNDGVCESGWSGYTCDCTPDYAGPNCSNDISFTLSGDASYILVSVNSLLLDLSDQGAISFRTIDTSALLLYAVWYNDQVPTFDYLTVEIVQGYIQLNTYIPEEHRLLNHSLYVSDGEWHTVQWSVMSQSHNQTSLSVTVDSNTITMLVPLSYTRATNDCINVFIGGTEDPQVLSEVVSESRSYFRGCVSSLYLDGAVVSLVASTPAMEVSQYNVGLGCSLVQPCLSQPCPSNATCIDMFDAHNCVCPSGYTGTNCDVEIDECLPIICENNGTCIDDIGFSYCDCQPGYNGSLCEDVIDPCDQMPCSNDGVCSPTGGLNFTCSCLAGYMGDICDIEIDECSSNPCLNNGTCFDLFNDYNCSCLSGYSGINCQTDIDDCVSSFCMNGAQCIDGIDSYTCNCSLGFSGTLCEVNDDDCAPMPCANGATCIDGINKYQCICPNMYITGTNCDDIIPPCDLDPCQNGGNCSDVDSVAFSGFSSGDYPPLWAYECDCPPEYFGTNCELSNHCNPDPCLNNATCDSVMDSFVCTCIGGYTGTLCENMVNPCNQLPPNYCNNGTCEVDNDNFMFCQCNQDFTGPTCMTAIDNCSPDPCENGASCINLVGDYLCVCPLGYTGDNCEIDIDNCSPDPCENGASCMDLVDDYLCVCPLGYTGDNCEIDIDNCSPDPCENGASCMDLVGDYQCMCTPGYTGNRCEDDVCGNVECNSGSCVDGNCVCSLGFTGGNCETDIDNCSGNPCANQATCVDEVNDFTCICPYGITGSLCDIVMSPCDSSLCLNGATCVSNDYFLPISGLGSSEGEEKEQPFSCVCPATHTGLLCDVPLCSVACLNGGVCIDGNDGPSCDCPIGLSGIDCSVDDVNDCQPNPCINGNCTDLFMDYLCTCEADFTGDNCSMSMNPCQPNPCQNQGSCMEYNDTFDCDCLNGFTGSICQDIDFCMIEGYPCNNGATCINNQVSMEAECACPPGFTGQYCSVSLSSPCNDNPCQNNGTCVFLSADDYECNCTNGYSGVDCEDVDECVVDMPCHNGATCLDTETGFVCVCAHGYTDTLCDEVIDGCAVDPCMNGATCVSMDIGQLLTPENVMCLCLPYYTGELCDVYIHPCTNVVCQNGGECTIDDANDTLCLCPMNYTGAFCEEVVSPCQSDPCQNGGTCISGVVEYVSGSGSGSDILSPAGDYLCVCPSGFIGPVCNKEDVCSHNNNPCVNGATCDNENGQAICICPSGYTGDDCGVPIIDYCEFEMCDNGGSCVSGEDGFSCICPIGFTNDLCDTDINECSNITCSDVGFCIESATNITDILPPGEQLDPGYLLDVPSPGDFLCICPAAYSGVMCEIADFCYSNPCNNNGTCISHSENGTFTCNCSIGYSGDTCSNDTNECIDNPCMNNGICVESASTLESLIEQGLLPNISVPLVEIGEFACICNGTYEGDLCEIKLPSCSDGPCADGATCIPHDMQGFQCICAIGYTGIDCEQDIDECLEVVCENNGTCIESGSDLSGMANEALVVLPSLGEFQCLCSEDYIGDVCQYVDPCNDPSPCSNGDCESNDVDDYYCLCSEGYTGDTCNMSIPCFNNPCNNGGICVDSFSIMDQLLLYNVSLPDEGEFVCVCDPEYTGDTCDVMIDPCAMSPCDNGGTCIDNGGNTYECICPLGYTGDNCSVPINYCEFEMCDNGGSCVSGEDGFSCICPVGFTDDLCGTDINECSNITCSDVGFCIESATNITDILPPGEQLDPEYLLDVPSPGDFLCICPAAYSGVMCEIADFCYSSPCNNNGTCISLDEDDTFTCNCSVGYSGDTCSNDTNECIDDPCMNNGICVESSSTLESLIEQGLPDDVIPPLVSIGDFVCICNDAFVGDLCEVPSANCSQAPCQNGGMCLEDEIIGFVCVCANGYSDILCDVDIDECADSPCLNGGICVDSNSNSSDVSLGEYQCICIEDYIGVICQNINPCANLSLCVNGDCISDDAGDYNCTCYEGYTGEACDNISIPCFSNPCNNGSFCIDSYVTIEQLQLLNLSDIVLPDEGEFLCVCDPEYTGDTCDIMIDPCAISPCDNGGTCIDNGGNTYECICPPGYTGDDCGVIDYCDFQMCDNGGSCVSGEDGFSCICPVGFTDDLCGTDINECSNVTCSDVGFCIESATNITDILPLGEQLDLEYFPSPGDYLCICPAAYSGDMCEIADFCYSSPCNNNGTCISHSENSTFTCNCSVGYSGDTCSNDTNECIDNPCMNNGICVESATNITELLLQIPLNEIETPDNPAPGEFLCLCPPSFVGDTCEFPDVCFFAQCNNGATCISHVNNNTFTCVCVPGYSGDTCDIDIDECSDNPCMNNGVCIESLTTLDSLIEQGLPNNFSIPEVPVAEFICVCNSVYFGGDMCEIPLQNCSDSPCKNGATCVANDTLGFVCLCPVGLTGVSCDTDINECADNICSNNGTCIESGTDPSLLANLQVTLPLLGDSICVCPDAFLGDTCQIANPCAESSLCVNGTCTNDNVGNYNCTCFEGYTGDACNIVIPCFNNPCNNGGICVDSFSIMDQLLLYNVSLPDEGEFVCVCDPEYTGDTCDVMIDPCAMSPCDNGGACIDNGGNMYACICPSGYTGDDCGINIDDCDPSPCINGNCTDLLNNHSCSCFPGYTGENCDTPIDYCAQNPCDNGGTCSSDTLGYSCTCPIGYTGNECTVDINECVTGTHMCMDGTCVNLEGSYSCTCNQGITGQYCDTDIDECVSSDVCVNGECINFKGGYNCTCINGFTGDSCMDDVNECDITSICNNGSCSNTLGSYMCTCSDGFTGPDCLAVVGSVEQDVVPVAVSVPVVLMIVIATMVLLLVVILIVVARKRRRKRHGSYSPATVERDNEPDMTDLGQQRERLI